MFKYFLSEGVVCKHKLLLATLDNDPEKLVCLVNIGIYNTNDFFALFQQNLQLRDLPSPVDSEIENVNKQDGPTDESIKIAWRYKDLDPVQSTIGSGLQFGHYFDISKPIDQSTLDLVDKKIWKLSPPEKSTCFKFFFIFIFLITYLLILIIYFS